MKITEVEAVLMSCPLPEPLRMPFWGGERTILKRDAMLIRVKADNGLMGYAPGPAHEIAARQISEVIRPFLVGRDPRRWAEIQFRGDPETTKTYRAVEIALMDLTARFEGAPLSELIGGRKRDRIKLYGSAGMYMSPRRFAEEAAAIAGLGFTAYKMRPALGP
jgi:L-alanine-DL-glutamate epimerase-like enolase superfamily enzyme